MKNLVIAAGGTGGHISPGIALAEEILQNLDHFRIGRLYIHSPQRNRENPDLKEIADRVEIIWHNLPQLKITNSLIFPFLFFFEFTKTFFQFRRRKIDLVIGMGGYSSLLALLYSVLFGKILFLCEQNCHPGKITRRFWNYAKKVALSFPILDSKSKDPKAKVLGNPVRKKVLPKTQSLKKSVFTGKNPMNVLVLGGSQGARQINEMVLNSNQDKFIQSSVRFRVLTGSNLYDEFRRKSDEIEAISYSQDMKQHYEWADVVVARSGAGVIAECLLFSLPMILIPYPYAMDNHQKANADFIVNQGAAVCIDRKDSDPIELIQHLKNLWESPDILLGMQKECLALSRINASHDIMEYFLQD
jgi:UDP-N-acetylglucosamine--N-acetylmuramyl-(pentapeptide) pyrophosphoryl-undecaprenol N-acetylglucosamine transferase